MVDLMGLLSDALIGSFQMLMLNDLGKNMFQGSVWKKIILACCYYMLAIVPEFLFAVITGAYGVTGTENNFHSELEKLLSLLLMSTITFLLVKCVNQITRKKN